jgi:hypothetical protein
MNDTEQMTILRNAGYFQNGDDAISLIAAVDTHQIPSEELRSQVSAMAAQIRTLQAEVKRLKIVEETLRSLLK